MPPRERQRLDWLLNLQVATAIERLVFSYLECCSSLVNSIERIPNQSRRRRSSGACPLPNLRITVRWSILGSHAWH
jgi:hypothetical protein